MNLRPSGYEPDELPDCSTPHQEAAHSTPRAPENTELLVQYLETDWPPRPGAASCPIALAVPL